MKYSLYISVYSITLLLSAALLFAIQPMFSKMLLPLLGGNAAGLEYGHGVFSNNPSCRL